jgi:signal transduction histidine kinase
MQVFSLRQRLTWRFALSLFGLMLLVWAVGLVAIHYAVERVHLIELERDTQALIERLAWTQDGQMVLTTDGLRVNYDQLYSGHYFVIHGQRTTLLRSASLGDFSLQLKARTQAMVDVFELPGPLDSVLLVRFSQHFVDGRWVELAVAEDYTDVKAALWRFFVAFSLAMWAVFAMIMLMYWRGLQRGFASVPCATSQLGLQALQTNLLGGKIPLEWLPLADRLHQALIQLHAQAWRQHASSSAYESVWPLDLHRLLEVYQVRAPHLRFQFRYDMAPSHWLIGQEDMQAALRSLLDNAVAWAKTEVHMVVQHQGDKLCIRIEDDGDGMEPARLEQIQQRTQAKALGEENTGLRLLEEIVYAYQGRLSFEGSKRLGGLSVLLCFDRPCFE